MCILAACSGSPPQCSTFSSSIRMRLGAQQYGNRTGGYMQYGNQDQVHVENIPGIQQTDHKRLNINSHQNDQHPRPAVRENTRDTISILHTTLLDTVAKTNWLQIYVIEGGFEVVAAMLDKPYTLTLAS